MSYRRREKLLRGKEYRRRWHYKKESTAFLGNGQHAYKYTSMQKSSVFDSLGIPSSKEYYLISLTGDSLVFRCGLPSQVGSVLFLGSDVTPSALNHAQVLGSSEGVRIRSCPCFGNVDSDEPYHETTLDGHGRVYSANLLAGERRCW